MTIDRRELLVGAGSLLATSPAITAAEAAQEKVFRAEWWKIYEVAKDAAGLFRWNPPLHPEFVLGSLVTDASPAAQDPTMVMTIWASCARPDGRAGACIVMVSAAEWPVDAIDSAQRIENLCDRYRVGRLIVSGGALDEIKTTADTERPWSVHATAYHSDLVGHVAPFLRDGLVYLPGVVDEHEVIRLMDWADAAEMQINAFPLSARDGYARSMVLALQHLHECGIIRPEAA